MRWHCSLNPKFFMILLIDIGNTNITIGFSHHGSLQATLRLATLEKDQSAERFIDSIQNFIRHNKLETPEGASICSVVPDVTPLLSEAAKKICAADPVLVSHEIETGLYFSIDNAPGLGTDRIANAVAAHTLYSGDLIIVDIGTATTFCVVTEDGEYKGGAIMPGPGLSVNALSDKTAKLPEIKLGPISSSIGKNTEDNIRAGIVLGHAGAIDRIVTDIKDELKKDMTVIITGGYADLINPYINSDYTNPDLTLEGLKIIHKLNS